MSGPSDILPGHPAYNLERHFEYLLKLRGHFHSEEQNKERIEAVELKLVSLERVESLMPHLSRFVDRLFYENHIMYCDQLEDFPAIRELYMQMEDRMLDKNREDRALVAVQRFYLRLFQLLPEFVKQPYHKRDAEGGFAFDESAPTVPFLDVVNPYAVFQIARDEFSVEDGPGKYTFHRTRRQMGQNILRAAGHTPETYRGQSIDIQKCDPHTLFHDTPVEEFFKARIEFTIPDRFWNEHAFIAGRSGHGKSQTLQHFIGAFLDKPDPPAMFVIDSMGAMLKLIANKYGHLSDRLVIIDPTATPRPQLNFFKMQASPSLYFYLFKAIDQSLTPRQQTMISFLIALMQKIQGSNLDTLRTFCESRTPLYQAEMASLEPVQRDFFNNQFFGKDALVNQTKQQIISRLYALSAFPRFNEMMNAPVNEFDPARCIEEKKIVLVNTNAAPHPIGLDEASPVFGRFIIAQCLYAARLRVQIPADKRHLALLFVDEASPYMDSTTETILSTARQFGLGFVQATQYLAQIPDPVRRAIFGNTAIKLAGDLTHNDSVVLARDMRCEPDFIQDMKKYHHDRTEWACYVANYTDRAVKLNVPHGVMERLPDSVAMVPRKAAPPLSPGSSSPKHFIPGVDQRCQVTTGGYAWYPNGARITRVDIQAGHAWVDPRPFAKEGDPKRSFELSDSPISFSDLTAFTDTWQPPPGVIVTPPPTEFIPGIGMRVQVVVNGQAWFPHGARVVKVDVYDRTTGFAWVDPRPFAQQSDPAHCFALPNSAIPFADIIPYQESKPQSPPPADDPTKPAPF